MAARANKPVSVTLGALGKVAEERVRTGHYSSVSEVVRAGLRALEREEAAFDEIIRAKVAEALADPRPDLTSEQVTEALRIRHEGGRSGS